MAGGRFCACAQRWARGPRITRASQLSPYVRTARIRIGAAYGFTGSTSFANPAITVARSLTDTFSGIRPHDAPGFILAEIVGALLALPAASVLSGPASCCPAEPENGSRARTARL